jgi:hypothetical protein
MLKALIVMVLVVCLMAGVVGCEPESGPGPAGGTGTGGTGTGGGDTTPPAGGGDTTPPADGGDM